MAARSECDDDGEDARVKIELDLRERSLFVADEENSDEKRDWRSQCMSSSVASVCSSRRSPCARCPVRAPEGEPGACRARARGGCSGQAAPNSRPPCPRPYSFRSENSADRYLISQRISPCLLRPPLRRTRRSTARRCASRQQMRSLWNTSSVRTSE